MRFLRALYAYERMNEWGFRGEKSNLSIPNNGSQAVARPQQKLSNRWKASDTPGRVLLTSSAANEATFYTKSARNSPLTASVIESMRRAADHGQRTVDARALAERVEASFEGNTYWRQAVRSEMRGSAFALNVVP